MNYRLAQRFERSIQEMVFPTLRLLTGLRQLELDLTGASWDGHIDSHMLNVIRGPFPFQLECFALNKPSSDEMELLSELLVSQQSITCLLLNWSGSTTSLMSCPPPRHVLDPGQWHLLKNWPITHLFAALMYPDEVSDLFGSLSQSTATLQLLWFMTPSRLFPKHFSRSWQTPLLLQLFRTCGISYSKHFGEGTFVSYHSFAIWKSWSWI
ncbi:hypothetical protein BS47DRAFT_905265 [Hydnum rufescens UP504]|uniref:Uncharacterized protein n=1 Tax=Hydnum rufescens UP504 TaxID=1448309 RepID=A0A9P6ADK6_9AGAM|nr:hypothetical protein BS47DRAFT_905265 [Hydnum rufescens UP504]